MEFIADLHLHSKYSRATSKEMNLESLDKWAKVKGIRVLGTGDFSHPLWFKELREKLEPDSCGLFKLKKEKKEKGEETRFLLSTEVSCIFFQEGKIRKIHLIILAPSFEIVEKINAHLNWLGNLEADGRPILRVKAKELLKIVLDISEECLIVPAHIWTPWFSLFGSRSGFDTIEECFGEYAKYIFAGETGLSSDPPMNWRLSSLDKITLISNSDAHSPKKIGREANVFEGEGISYLEIIKAIKKESKKLKLISTLEFYPQEGKYHYDGHRECKVSLSPKETKKYNGICPVCGKPLTIGVLSRVEQLADRKEGYKPENAISFKSLIPLEEIIAEVLGKMKESKEVQKIYDNLIREFGSEFDILLRVSPKEIGKKSLSEIEEGIKRMREGKVFIEPGYDGVFGKIRLFSKKEKKDLFGQKALF